MQFGIRLALVVLGVGVLGVAYAFARGVPEVVGFWPYSTTYGLSKIFIAAMFAAIGTPIIWIGLSNDLAALRSGAVNVVAVGAGLGGQAVWKVAMGMGTPRLIVFGVAALGLAIAAAVMVFLTRKIPWRDTRLTPWLVRLAFALFVFVLLVAGGLLVQRVQVFPWVLEADAAIAYGIMFLGAAAYFMYGLMVPVWSNAKGQLMAFLVYDLVLLVPYMRLWPASAGDQRLGLSIYLGVLAVSGVIALWFLVFNPIWRLGRGPGVRVRQWRRRAAPTEAEVGEAL